MSDSVCAVVVTYNRKNLLLECLEALQRQTRPIQGIYLIDNASSDETPELLLEKNYITELPPQRLEEPWEKELRIPNFTDGNYIKLHYVRMHRNSGGAGGFYEGVKRGYERGYDWLWLMDDDAEAKPDALEKLFIYKKEGLCLCPLIIGHDGKYQFYHHKIVNKIIMLDNPINNNIEKIKEISKIDSNAFVGPLINRKIIGKVGFPIKEMFIWGDDLEYIYRISRSFKVYLIKESIMLHKDLNMGINKRLKESQRWKLYYYFRNKIIFIKKFCPFNLLSYLFFLYRASRTAMSLILIDRDFKNAILPFKGIISGLKIRVS